MSQAKSGFSQLESEKRTGPEIVIAREATQTLSDVKVREKALTEAVEENRERLFSFITKRIQDSVEAEDVLQDVFSEFLVSYDLGHSIETLSAWLVQVAKNKIIDRFRRWRNRSNYETSPEAVGEASVVQPDREWSQTLLREQIINALTELPEEQRDVYVKHELEGKSFEAISRESGVGVNTLLARKRYAVLNLRKYLKEAYDELE